MKKTLTVNLGGTVFHIDEDAYQLLDKYLSNLRIHFRQEEGSDEIMDDFEMRISELLNERVRLGYEVITINEVEEVIRRMGKPEEIFADEKHEEYQEQGNSHEKGTAQAKKRLMRDPDNRILGGVAGGFAAYMDWDPTLVRIGLFLLMFFYGIMIPIYFLLWIIVPLAKTATDKLEMRGENITVENIGKTVTDGFERVSNNISDYVKSGQPRTFLQKAADLPTEIHHYPGGNRPAPTIGVRCFYPDCCPVRLDNRWSWYSISPVAFRHGPLQRCAYANGHHGMYRNNLTDRYSRILIGLCDLCSPIQMVATFHTC